MEEKPIATKTDASTVATKEEVVITPTEDDAEAKIQALEAEKARLISDNANYKLAMMKKEKKEEIVDIDETEEDRISRIVAEKLSETKLAQIDLEKEILLKKLAKENKELKLAQMNKTNIPPATVGSHSETTAVRDTAVTPEQLNAFKARGWTDKDIERYKKNLARYGK